MRDTSDAMANSAKGWIARIENGTIAITVEGVDRADSELRRDTSIRLMGS